VFETIDPEGSERTDWYVARILAMISNVFGNSEEAPRTPLDYYVNVWDRLKEMEKEEQPKEVEDQARATLEALMNLPGARLKKKGKLFNK